MHTFPSLRTTPACLPLLALFVATLAAAQPTAVTVLKGSPYVMVDGLLSPGEWNDAARIVIPETGELLIKESGPFVWIAVHFTKKSNGIVDLYLSAADGELYDLHASAKLGERMLEHREWPEFSWWNNQGWVANWAHVDSWEKRSLLPSDVREFQIRRDRFPGKTWKLRLELTMFRPDFSDPEETVFPRDAKERSTEGWLELKFQ